MKLYSAIMISLLWLCLTAMPTFAADPYSKPDRSYVSLTGTVASTVASKGIGFTLDYGEGSIIVEADDWDLDEDARVYPGERVTVKGLIDKDLFERRSIEASSVYVHPRNVYYFASSADEEPRFYGYNYYPGYPLDGSWMTVSGTVKSVSPNSKSFEIDTGARDLKVMTDDLGYNPLDNIGFQKLRKGDRISVTGILDKDFLDEDDIRASSVITLSKGKMAKASG